MLKIPKIEDKKIEERSKKSQEKFADQCMIVSTNIIKLSPVVHLGDYDFNVVDLFAVAEVKPLDEGQCCQLGKYSG